MDEMVFIPPVQIAATRVSTEPSFPAVQIAGVCLSIQAVPHLRPI